ncbi:MAG: hypothetical protein COU06_00405 [Candidatus Harrisonbacteria bacterium CG10_big_fil_rev_8_21_14_0_10_38_8]|uniref:Glycosyl transferase family 25 domain-containing protein n=1 Tax=Candidatus Harrisonbacteria bacterium CG10_big_fil_rev_8_21_14_0_10_38_8 TaxID=1974582 RepID=A0A2M6WKK3_9BACT|nr:MAG: hypothetical protein COU06_00405 [Candidatus Harrisonbacteria bacterium CG10_big_fil_rev_8_21_14_0_10_38_8]
MIKTFVINLDKDKERMRFMDKQLTTLGIKYERIPGVYGKTYTPTIQEYNIRLVKEKNLRLLPPGDLGCALSHQQAYKKLLREELEYVLILEDDVELPSNFKDIIEKVTKNNKNWEYLLFDYPVVGLKYLKIWYRSIKDNYKIKSRKSNVGLIFFILYSIFKALYIIPISIFEGIRNQLREKYPGPVYFLRPMYFAGAYIITRSAAEKLVQLNTPVMYASDQLPNQARVKSNLRFMCYSPRVVRQKREIFGSSILNTPPKMYKNYESRI